MKIKMLTSISGHADPENGMERDFSFVSGETVEVPDGLASKWIGSKLAESAAQQQPRKAK